MPRHADDVRGGSLLIGAALILSACGPSAEDVNVVAGCAGFEGQPAPVTVNGGRIEPAVGQSFTVTLCSNPSTGYSWSDDVEFDASVVELTGRTYMSPAEASPPVVGQAGSEVFTFRAVGAGTTTIQMTYERPFEPEQPPQWTFQVEVLVD
jgi:inhibitor of cysteine peptidase